MTKSINLIFLSLLMVGFLVSNTSCKKDSDPDRDVFLGAYSVVETCGTGNDTYDITIIESGSDEKAIVISNLYDWDENLSATVNGNNLTIPSQIADGITFVGTGTISNNTLTINFTLSAAGDSDTCNAVCTRK